jgi:hypothetical protein
VGFPSTCSPERLSSALFCPSKLEIGPRVNYTKRKKSYTKLEIPSGQPPALLVETPAQLSGYRANPLREKRALIEFWSVAFASRHPQQTLTNDFFLLVGLLPKQLRLTAAWTSRGSCGPIFLRASLADFKRPSAERFAVQAFDGCAAFRFIAHRHEWSETSGLACFSIGYDLNLCHATKFHLRSDQNGGDRSRFRCRNAPKENLAEQTSGPGVHEKSAVNLRDFEIGCL